MKQSTRYTLWLALICYALTALYFSNQLGMTEQESYYWLWSKNLDWSYFDHPPLQAWLTAMLTYFLGDEKWVVRLPAICGVFATLILFYHWVRSKWGDQAAQLSSILLVSSNVFLFGSVIALPDSLAIPLGLAAIIYTERGKVIRASIFLGLSLLAKWTVFFIVPGLLFNFYQQKKLNRKNLFLLIIIPLILHSPVIWWNILHGGASIKFHLYDRHSHEFQTLLNYFKNIGAFLLTQIFAIGLVSSALIIILLIQLKKSRTSEVPRSQWQSLLAWILPGLVVVFISAIQGEDRFYWTFLSWIPAIAVLGYLVSVQKYFNIRLIKVGTIGFIFIKWALAGAAGFYPVGTMVEAVFHLKHDLRHSPIGDISGWREWLDHDLMRHHLIDIHTALIGSDLHVTSRMAWSMREHKIFNFIGVNSEKQNQFQFWSQPEPPEFTNAIFFGDNRYDHLTEFQNRCGHPLLWNTSEIRVIGQPVKEIYWSRCLDLKYYDPRKTTAHFGVKL